MSPAVASASERTEAQALARHVAALPEPAMRRSAMARALASMGDARATALLQGLIAAAHLGEAPCVAVYHGLTDPQAALTLFGRPRLEALYEEAQRQGSELALSWLYAALTPPVAADEAVEPLVHRALQRLTLGDRRALARRCRGEALKRVLVDPDPGVIDNVLNNPSTVEASVLVICSHRPTVPPPLCCVLRHERWNRRYRVRLALVRNPFLPPPFGINLLVTLKDSDLRLLCHDAILSDGLRFAAERLLRIGGQRQTVGG